MQERSAHPVFPFVALVSQEAMKLSLLLNVIDPGIGGVMILGHRGTAKSTAVRGLASLMPGIKVIAGCPYNAAPDDPCGLCEACSRVPLQEETLPVPVIDLPLGATEDRVAGTLDLEAALLKGKKSFEPGLLARSHRGFLYIDEVNLLEDHLVDLLLDVAAAGINIVERESVSVRHPARFVLIGSGNPEEGELRPQLLDRFGLSVRVVTEDKLEDRVEITRRRLRFDQDPVAFCQAYEKEEKQLQERIRAARTLLPDVSFPDDLLTSVVQINSTLEIDGHRGELTSVRAARAKAAFDRRTEATPEDLAAVVRLALSHRLRKDPLETRDLAHRIDDAVQKHLPAAQKSDRS